MATQSCNHREGNAEIPFDICSVFCQGYCFRKNNKLKIISFYTELKQITCALQSTAERAQALGRSHLWAWSSRTRAVLNAVAWKLKEHKGSLPESTWLWRATLTQSNIVFLGSREFVLCHRVDSGLVTLGLVLKTVNMTPNTNHSISYLDRADLHW